MATLTGQNGLVVLGGHLIGSAFVNGAVAQGGTSVNIDNNGSGMLIGVIAPGDTFTITGVSGTYTVTNTAFLVAASNAITGITFTPAAPVGGFPDNSAFNLTLATIAQVRRWTLNPVLQALETTVMRDKVRSYRGGLAGWTGSCEALFDYGDTRQAALIDEIAAATPDGTRAAVLFGLKDGDVKDFYGGAVLTNFAITEPSDALVAVTFDFQSDGVLAITYV